MRTAGTQERDDRESRHQRLIALHGKVLQLILHESRFVLDRTNTYLLSTSLLLTAFFVSLSQKYVISIAIPVIGLLLSLVQPFVIARTISALEFWRSTVALIEQDPDYWFPGKVAADEDLDFTSARARFWRGEETRQGKSPLRFGRPPSFVMRLHPKLPDPNTFFSTWIPALMGSVWCAALAVAAVRVF